MKRKRINHRSVPSLRMSISLKRWGCKSECLPEAFRSCWLFECSRWCPKHYCVKLQYKQLLIPYFWVWNKLRQMFRQLCLRKFLTDVEMPSSDGKNRSTPVRVWWLEESKQQRVIYNIYSKLFTPLAALRIEVPQSPSPTSPSSLLSTDSDLIITSQAISTAFRNNFTLSESIRKINELSIHRLFKLTLFKRNS